MAAPSANRFGRVSPTRAADVRPSSASAWIRPRPGRRRRAAATIGVESTIVDCTVDPPRVLRAGAISQAQVDAVLAAAPLAASSASRPRIRPRLVGRASASTGRDSEVVRRSAAGDPARAPGMLDSHYAPRARVRLVEARGSSTDRRPAERRGRWGLIAPAGVATPTGCVRLAAPASAEEYARDLYAALRHGDEQGLDGDRGRAARPRRTVPWPWRSGTA